ncbi:hypothetical protein BDQ12DRAFT_709471 [Crucibulum laeve]|uniref:RING-type domain-containing protein n=1 Tax=Crucibulum laeve TaxID=68775 RepID=A0A5C3MEX0_9AGAR|nr:hypothetical protein BDQ12DRAFT_709471 [Crucibulum laeve]
MAIPQSAKGKKRAYEESRASSSSLLPVPMEQPLPVKKKPKRAETRQCPVCDEHIPLRLLAMHAQLETERVDLEVQKVGSVDVVYEDLDDDPGCSSRNRRSALKARKSMGYKNTDESLEQVNKTLQTVKRHRKLRHTKFKEMAREEEEGYQVRNTWARGVASGEIVCPVCAAAVRGDQDVLDAHVDACLANESRRIEEERLLELEQRRAQDEDVWDNDDVNGNGGHVGDVRGGTGFHTRDRHAEDVDEEIDIDGDDTAFGDAQFTEGDILPINFTRQDVEEDIEVESEGEEEEEAQIEKKSLRDLVAEGKIVRRATPLEGVTALKAKMDEVMGLADTDKMELAVRGARKRGDKNALITALENKVKQLESMRVSSSTSLLCRICIDPYNEPTVSTGCWHTCCRECWLRCLGSTKLCPICKRITGATDLRRVYL